MPPQKGFLFDLKDEVKVVTASNEEEARIIFKYRYGVTAGDLLGII